MTDNVTGTFSGKRFLRNPDIMRRTNYQKTVFFKHYIFKYFELGL